MIETIVTVSIGGHAYHCAPMPFYCLERAWPHIQRMGAIGDANQALTAAKLQVELAATDDEKAAAARALAEAEARVGAIGGDMIGQTRVALEIIVAALALEVPAPSYEDLAKRMRADEMFGVHSAVSALMTTSGLTANAEAPPGEGSATAQMPPRLNGAGSSPSLRHTA